MNKIITVNVIAGARVEKVEEIESDVFKIKVNKQREKGKANERIQVLLASYFNIPKSKIILKSGLLSKKKKFLINL